MGGQKGLLKGQVKLQRGTPPLYVSLSLYRSFLSLYRSFLSKLNIKRRGLENDGI